MARPRRREDYEPNVLTFMPFVKGEELLNRTSLLWMRDRAMGTKRFACEYSWDLLTVIERLATDLAFRRMDPEDLTAVRQAAIRLANVAANLDRVFVARPTAEDAGD